MADAVIRQRILDDGTVVIDLRGELDIAVNDALRDVLVDTIATRRPPRLVVNMLHVTFVDSTGMGALLAGYNAAVSGGRLMLIGGYNAAHAAGVEYQVRDVAPFVEQQLRTTGIYDRLVSRQG